MAAQSHPPRAVCDMENLVLSCWGALPWLGPHSRPSPGFASPNGGGEGAERGWDKFCWGRGDSLAKSPQIQNTFFEKHLHQGCSLKMGRKPPECQEIGFFCQSNRMLRIASKDSYYKKVLNSGEEFNYT